MLKDLSVIQVVGFKNSGKTSLVCNMIRWAAESGISVSSCKHHGHGGKPDMVEGTDSTLHKRAGATIAGVEGDGMLQLAISKRDWQLDDILSIYSYMKTDLIIVEGYKRERYPKIVLLRNQSDRRILQETENVIAVIAPFPIEEQKETIAYFSKDGMKEFEKWYLLWVQASLKKERGARG
ncbi:molybdopterin-guanine dinucleotide biosynthesis protein B [Rossellomorea sp. SC111]|uniref:molybdopterin-guanine dinucleotide biosynthesis protein B n=1 Tax=Rossellomorea sp. SC111 TaxID=2968985 RepID=UPI00215A44A1|nr:molybdopterin-guanine dinucleotide biosynthesis protein B [Rossellomorea sp. SC111]MCR8850922.1 molybdopterin-guanine dinucleotide biosynthesis protein B [Rossellomorea sp. SC111]